MSDIKVGKITHYYDKIGVAVLKVEEGVVRVGDEIRIGDEATGFKQQVVSMQLEHDQVEEAKAGMEVGLKVDQKVSENADVYKTVN